MAKRSRRIGDLTIVLLTAAWITGAAGAGFMVTHNAPTAADAQQVAAAPPPTPVIRVHQVLPHHPRRLSIVRRT